jgi:hypothetical protein
MTGAGTARLPIPARRATRLERAVQHEQALILFAFGVVGLHLADDNFLQPQPGTSPGEHLVSGLLPLGLLAVGAIMYIRLRPGARATWALLVGFFGVLTGSEAAISAASWLRWAAWRCSSSGP